jgi:hypothetical protein
MTVKFHKARPVEYAVFSLYINLSIAALQIEGEKPFGSYKRVQGVVDPGQWNAAFSRHVVQLPVVHTETEFQNSSSCQKRRGTAKAL